MSDIQRKWAERLSKTTLAARSRLLDAQVPEGFWEGELSGSALSTAVAVFALARADLHAFRGPVRKGLEWLAAHANADGSWGDTADSPGNASTTLLAWSALSVAAAAGVDPEPVTGRAEHWLTRRIGSLEPDAVARAVLEAYGNDRTFSAPILLMTALAGRLGPKPSAWDRVPQLPFELAALPRGLFRRLGLPVVSYALPALIAIGLCRHANRPARCPVFRRLRTRLTPRVLETLVNIQPENGGYLEATPLTGFVVMSLSAGGHSRHPAAEGGIRFLLRSQRASGCWPIDTNLSTWVTTLAVQALASGAEGAEGVPGPVRHRVRRWLVAQQSWTEHPFTGAAPGGWAWTHLPGGVPDADDTAGALNALSHLRLEGAANRPAAESGLEWLLGLQNRDGGFPTFCRGWGKLPFDRSCPDITAHALQAMAAWRDEVPVPLSWRIDRAAGRALAHLGKTQDRRGFWVPLWFGNQHTRGQRNPTVGTARVLLALEHPYLSERREVPGLYLRAQGWLLQAQGPEGGWGGDEGCVPGVEETALALGALAFSAPSETLLRGVRWLAEATADGRSWPSAPIGLYFARLWYSERLYPLVFGLWALNRLRHRARVDTHFAGLLAEEGRPGADRDEPAFGRVAPGC